MVVGLFGCLGLARCMYIGTSYAFAKYGLRYEKQRNSILLESTVYLRRAANYYAAKMAELISFEDKTRLAFGLNSISSDIRMAGVGGPPSVEESIRASLADPKVAHADSVLSNVRILSREAALQSETFTRMQDYIVRQYDYWLQRPLTMPTEGRITSGFGYRVDPFFELSSFHTGMDIANREWTPIHAPGDAIVADVGVKNGFGNVVVLDHRGTSYVTLFGHLQQSAVVMGQVVKRGELIGYMGSSGRSTGPHLHYEVHKNGSPVNPAGSILPKALLVD